MVNTDKNVFIQETEIKPNKYAMFVLFLLMVCDTFCWILNEAGIFRVGKNIMRIGCSISIALTIILTLVLYFRKDLRSNNVTKYVIVTVSIIITIILNTLLYFHTTLMILFPIAIAMLYRSKSLGLLAAGGSILCTMIAPIIGYVLGVWDVPLFQELILIATNVSVEIVGATGEITLLSVGKIILYLVLPRVGMVGAFSVLALYVIKISAQNVENRIALNNMNRRDLLTGLYNRNYYDKILASSDISGTVGLVFFDVNNLKQLNDSKGHEAGDILLKRCAESILAICDNDDINAFRIGGDEFVLFIENADDTKINKKLLEWRDNLNRINKENIELYDGLECIMASGYVIGDFRDINELVKVADQRMYMNKTRMKNQF